MKAVGDQVDPGTKEEDEEERVYTQILATITPDPVTLVVQETTTIFPLGSNLKFTAHFALDSKLIQELV